MVHSVIETAKKISPRRKTFVPLRCKTRGKMPEWSIGTVSKTVVPLRVPRVRIPVFPRKKAALKAAFFLHPERRDENPGGFVTAQRSAQQRIPVFPRKKAALKAAFFLHPERRDENPGGFVTAQRSAQQRIPVFPQKKRGQAENPVHLLGISIDVIL